MTESTEPAPAESAPVAPTETTPEPATSMQAPEPEDSARGNRTPSEEAKQYRVRLRETEAERDAHAETIRELRQQLIAGIIERDVRVKPDGVFAKATVDDFLTDGKIDPARVVEIATGIAATLGLQSLPATPKPDPSIGPKSGEPAADGWGNLFDRNTR